MAKVYQKDVRRPPGIRELASVESGVWQAQSFQLALKIGFRPVKPLRISFRYMSELRRNKQLDVCILGSRSDFPLNIKGRYRDGTDDDLHASQGVLDGFIVGIVDLDHLGITFNRLTGTLRFDSE